jgi:hypothetical protein
MCDQATSDRVTDDWVIGRWGISLVMEKWRSEASIQNLMKIGKDREVGGKMIRRKDCEASSRN